MQDVEVRGNVEVRDGETFEWKETGGRRETWEVGERRGR